MKDLFADFETITKAQWVERVERDLKDRSYGDLRWSPANGIEMDPFLTKEDVASIDHSVLEDAPAGWAVGEFVDGRTNAEVLEALNAGVEALSITVDRARTRAEWQDLLAGVELAAIQLHLYITDRDIVLDQAAMVHALGGESGTWAWLFLHYPAGDGDFELERALLDRFGPDPAVRALNIDARPWHGGSERTVKELSTFHDYLGELVHALTDRSAHVVRHLHADVHTGLHYFTEIAKLRALRLMVADRTGRDHGFVSSSFPARSYGEDAYDNMVHSTTLAMSAVLGGARHMLVTHPDADESAFHRRIARNVQLLLKHESTMEGRAQAAAGSYAIDHLTERLRTEAVEA